MYSMYPERISAFCEKALEWLGSVPFNSVKEASQAAKALCLWGQDAGGPIGWLQNARAGECWDTDNPVRDTARACAALLECGTSCREPADWLVDMQSKNGSWNDDVYDTCYALITLGLAGIKNRSGVEWLIDNLGEDWMHPGTIALINSALIHQDFEGTSDRIERNSSWLLARCTDDHWRYTATSCLVVQSLILDGRSGDVGRAMDWLLDRVEETQWKVSVVALVLITLKMYYHNSDTS